MLATLIDTMGDDLRVVNAARVSFDKESEWNWSYPNKEPPNDIKTTLKKEDQKLLTYLAKHNHWTPFSHVMITMREDVPIFVARQRFKHMVGFTYNEVSRRYVDDSPEFYTPDVWRKRAENAKQGSSDEAIDLNQYAYPDGEHISSIVAKWGVRYEPEHHVPDGHFQEQIECLIGEILSLYGNMIKLGVAPEQARMILPQSMYTSYYVTGSLAAWARAYKLRTDPHAQKEIRDLATQWGEIFNNIPQLEYSWSALTK